MTSAPELDAAWKADLLPRNVWIKTHIDPRSSRSSFLAATLALLTASCGHCDEGSTSLSGTGIHADVASDGPVSGQGDAPVAMGGPGSRTEHPRLPDGGSALTAESGGTPDLVLEGELETPGPEVPAPGHAHVISISRYRVIRVLHGDYPHPIVFVGHEFADMSSADFHVGVRRLLELTRRFPPNTSVRQPVTSEARAYGVYFCTHYRVLLDGDQRHD